MEQLLGEAALCWCGLEIVLVFGKIFGHRGEFAANFIPRVDDHLGRTVGRLGRGILLHCVLRANRKTRAWTRRGGRGEKRSNFHLYFLHG